MAKSKKYDQPFNRRIPSLFMSGGSLDKTRELGAKVRFMVEMPENHFSNKVWQNLYQSARTALADICFLEERCATYAELSQLDWLAEAGHRLWTADAERPRCNLNAYIAELRAELEKSENNAISLSRQLSSARLLGAGRPPIWEETTINDMGKKNLPVVE